MPLELTLHLEGRRRKEEPSFGLLSRAFARALLRRDASPIGEALGACVDPVEDVLFASRIHGVGGLVSELAGDRGLPPALLEALREDRARTARRAERLREDLHVLGARASRAGLPFIPLKGSYLANARYADPSLRPCADIDILAPPSSFEGWVRILREEGYALATESAKDVVFVKPGARRPDSFAEHPDNPRPVELHRSLATRLLGRTVDPAERYLAGLSEGVLLGVPALLPEDDAAALHLLVHAGPDLVGRGLRLVAFEDFRLLTPGDALAAGALALLGEAAWGLAALLVREMPDALPADVVARLEAEAPRGARRRAWMARPGLMTGVEERTVLALAEARLCRSPRDAARRLAHALPERSFLDRAYGGGPPLARLARYYRDRLSR